MEKLHRKRISIAIPASVVSDTPHLREKTSKIGLIGRAAAIFGVEEIIIYQDQPGVNRKADMDLIATMLSYMETPQYLRKRLFKLKPQLRYAGILPPLRTPHHTLGKRVVDLTFGEYRDGVTLAKTRMGTLVDIGVEKPALIQQKHLRLGKRVTVKITNIGEQVVAELKKSQEIPYYWGYKVTVWKNTFGRLAKSGRFALKIATSKHGAAFNDVKEKIAEKWKNSQTVLVIFGAPTQGLYEIAKKEGLKLAEVVDFVVNTVPGQCTETVRTEEALIATLAVFNCTFSFKV
ncbi:MAG: putative RNA uridine N3 methyltransferase [Candidatus Bathyarchaeia archaeon]|nr:RNA-binding protein [Candidatus Bathyarchaeota archaeon A05DMB-3]